jgi:hypothetical protein
MPIGGYPCGFTYTLTNLGELYEKIHVYFLEVFPRRLGGVVIDPSKVRGIHRQRYYLWAHRRCNDRV